MAQAHRMQKDGAGSPCPSSESLWTPVHRRDPLLLCPGPLGTHSKLGVLREGHLIKSRLSHHLLNVAQVALLPKLERSENPVNGLRWEVSISPHPQRVTSISLGR